MKERGGKNKGKTQPQERGKSIDVKTQGIGREEKRRQKRIENKST